MAMVITMSGSDMLLDDDMKKNNKRSMDMEADEDVINKNIKRSTIVGLGGGSSKGDSGSGHVVSPDTGSGHVVSTDTGCSKSTGLVDLFDASEDDAPTSYRVTFEKPSPALLEMYTPKTYDGNDMPERDREGFMLLSEDDKKFYLKSLKRGRLEYEGWKMEMRRELLYPEFSVLCGW